MIVGEKACENDPFNFPEHNGRIDECLTETHFSGNALLLLNYSHQNHKWPKIA